VDPILQSVWPYRYSFLSIWLVTFVILSAAILIMPQRYTVTSSIELASAIQDDRLEPIEPPAEVAKQITDVYLPSASSVLAGKGASPAALTAVQNLRVEAVGRSVVMRGRADPKFVNIYKEIQQTIVDQMVKDKAPLLQTIRGLLDIKMNSARSTSDELQKQIAAITTELADTATSSNYLNQRSKQRQAELATIRQRDTSESGDHKNVEPEIRELHDRISRSESASTDLAITRANYFNSLATLRQQDQEQRKIIADTAQEQKMLSDARVLHAPIVAPIPDGSRKLYMFAAAFVASILFAFGAIVLLCRLRSQLT
jgi:hypothetical protein